MTNNREDYLKIIYKLSQKNKVVNSSNIAKALNVTPTSSSEMLKKLRNEGLVNQDKNITLTDKGLEMTQDILTKHRLWETFLIQYLGFSWSEVDEQAELLEHATSDKLKERLNEFLNFPKHCPHGSIIFENTKNEIDTTKTALDLEVGDSAKLIKVSQDKDLLLYLDSINLKLNDDFVVVNKNNFDGSLSIKVNGEIKELSFKALKELVILT